VDQRSVRLIRRLRSRIGWLSAWASALLALACLASVVVTVISRGIASFRWDMLTTPTHGIAGGLQNAILGTLWLILWATVITAPLGVLGGMYTAWFANPRWADTVRFWTDVLSGVPSVVVGYVGYVVLVLKFGWGFSTLAGALALASIMLPYILRTTDAGLRQVPVEIREGGLALGLTPAQTVLRVGWRAAAPAAVSGILMAVAIGVGETAPLLFTAGWSPLNPSWQLVQHPVGYLTYVIWTYIEQPYPAAHALAYSAAFLLLTLILLLHVAARTGLRRRHRARV
jgi:phosphate transport system permease protein